MSERETFTPREVFIISECHGPAGEVPKGAQPGENIARIIPAEGDRSIVWCQNLERDGRTCKIGNGAECILIDTERRLIPGGGKIAYFIPYSRGHAN